MVEVWIVDSLSLLYGPEMPYEPAHPNIGLSSKTLVPINAWNATIRAFEDTACLLIPQWFQETADDQTNRPILSSTDL